MISDDTKNKQFRSNVGQNPFFFFFFFKFQFFRSAGNVIQQIKTSRLKTPVNRVTLPRNIVFQLVCTASLTPISICYQQDHVITDITKEINGVEILFNIFHNIMYVVVKRFVLFH